jgi:DNA-binding CsgD family transcriptional regulator
VATEIGYVYAIFRTEMAVSSGWLQRAHRLLDDLAPGPEQIWLALTEAELAYHGEGDMERVRCLGVYAKDLAGRLGLFDLQMLGLAVEGLALVGLGDVADGMRRLDEATTAAVAGEMETFQGVASTLCVMVIACERVQDVDRASQWCHHFMEFCSRNGLRGQLALCRVHYASVLTARGRWDEAEDQLVQALEGLRWRSAWSRPALVGLGELRRRQGRLDAAEEHFERAQFLPAGMLGQARVALDRGDYEMGLEMVEKILRRLPERNPLERVASLELLIRIRCQRGEVEAAEAALREAEGTAGAAGTTCILAMVSHGRGQVALAAGDAATAKAHLEDALDLYDGNRLPFEAALVRLDLGCALRALGRSGPALDHIGAALDAFRSLGAAVQVARAEALAGEISRAGAPEAGVGAGGLSPRELEVLTLLTRGLSNEQIAAELVVSKHTVRRHVSNILTKLDVPSRTAAAVYALEHKRA